MGDMIWLSSFPRVRNGTHPLCARGYLALLRTDAKLAMLLTVGGSPTPRVAAGTLRLTRAMLRLSRAMMFLRSRTVVIRHRVFFYMQMFWTALFKPINNTHRHVHVEVCKTTCK